MHPRSRRRARRRRERRARDEARTFPPLPLQPARRILPIAGGQARRALIPLASPPV